MPIIQLPIPLFHAASIIYIAKIPASISHIEISSLHLLIHVSFFNHVITNKFCALYKLFVVSFKELILKLSIKYA